VKDKKLSFHPMSISYILNSTNVLHARIFYVNEENSKDRTYNIRLFDHKKDEKEFTNESIIDLISDITKEMRFKSVSGSSKYRKYFPISSDENNPYTPNYKYDLIYSDEIKNI